MFNFDLVRPDSPGLDFPLVPRCDRVSCLDFIPFSDWRSSSYYDHSIHFFESDANYEAVWRYPQRYVSVLRSFSSVVMPDFSTYFNMPLPLAAFNHYRNCALARFFSDNGVKIIPNVSLYRSEFFDFFSQSLPLHSILAFSAVGAVKMADERQNMLAQLEYIFSELQPLEVLFFTSCDFTCPYDGDDRLTYIRIGGGYNGKRW